MLVELVHHAGTAFLADPGGPDFSNIGPDSKGVPKSGIMLTVGSVLLYFGLGIAFLVVVSGIIMWFSGHVIGGVHISNQAKSYILKAFVGALALTAAGGIWTWIVSQ